MLFILFKTIIITGEAFWASITIIFFKLMVMLLLYLTLIVTKRPTCKAFAGTENVIASLNTALRSSRFVEVFFLLTFLPPCSKYTFTNVSEIKQHVHIRFVCLVRQKM